MGIFIFSAQNISNGIYSEGIEKKVSDQNKEKNKKYCVKAKYRLEINQAFLLFEKGEYGI